MSVRNSKTSSKTTKRSRPLNRVTKGARPVSPAAEAASARRPVTSIEQDIEALLEGMSSALLVFDTEFRLRSYHTAVKGHFPELDLAAEPTLTMLEEQLGDPMLKSALTCAAQRQDSFVAEARLFGSVRYIRRVHVRRLHEAYIVTYTRLSSRIRDDALLDGQKAALELIAKRTPLQEILDYLLCFAEAQSYQPIKAAILLFDNDGMHLCQVAAPSLPAEYIGAVEGLSLGPELEFYGAEDGRRAVVVISDITEAPGWEQLRVINERFKLQACWMAPVLSTIGRVLGMLLTFSPTKGGLNPSERTLFDMVARTAAIAIEFTRQQRQATIRTQQQEAVARLGCRALEEHDLQSLLDQAMTEISLALDVAMTKILELQPDGKSLLLRAGRGWAEGLVGKATVSTGRDSQAGYTLSSSTPVIVADLRTESRFSGQPLLTQHKVVSGLSVLIAGEPDRPWGVLGVHTPVRRTFTPQDVSFVQSVANILAAMVTRRRAERALFESREQIRRQFAQLNAIYDTAPVGLCLLDTNLNFQNMNGHLAALIGMPTVKLAGKPLRDVLPEVSEQIEAICKRVLETHEPLLEQELRWQSTKSVVPRKRVWLCSCYPIKSSSDMILGINTVIQDITTKKRAEEERRRLAEIVASSNDAIIGKTLDGNITSWNAGAEKLYGYTAAEVMGKPVDILIPPELREEFAEIRKYIQTGKRVDLLETERLCKDGRRLHISLTISPIRDDTGRIVAASTIERDISERIRNEQALLKREERIQFILKSARVGTWDWDVQTDQVQWSDNIESMHGRPAGSFENTFASVLEEVHPDDYALINDRVKHALHGDGEYEVEYRIVCPNGSIRWLEGKGQVIRDERGQPVRMAGICMDITERKEAEYALRVSEATLRRQAEELASADRQKDEFLAMLGHELRNPLAPISNAVQVIKLEGEQLTPERLGWAVDIINRQTMQMVRLVDDLLDVARITRGRIRLKRKDIDLREVVNQAVETILPLIELRKQELVVRLPERPLIANVDSARLTQVIANVLNNAAKFTPESGRLEVDAAEIEGRALICVRDNGVGIHPDLLPHIFKLFVQADRSLDRTMGGLGLGLTLVKRLIELHGGCVAAHSAGEGSGTEIAIELPLVKQMENTTYSRLDLAAGATGDHKKRILVVDDNVDSAQALEALLTLRGHEVEVAYNGVSALGIVSKSKPNIIFLDIGLPDVSGYEVARQIKRDWNSEKQICVVALTGYGRAKEKDDGADVFDDYVLKPINMDHLNSLLARY